MTFEAGKPLALFTIEAQYRCPPSSGCVPCRQLATVSTRTPAPGRPILTDRRGTRHGQIWWGTRSASPRRGPEMTTLESLVFLASLIVVSVICAVYRGMSGMMPKYGRA